MNFVFRELQSAACNGVAYLARSRPLSFSVKCYPHIQNLAIWNDGFVHFLKTLLILSHFQGRLKKLIRNT